MWLRHITVYLYDILMPRAFKSFPESCDILVTEHVSFACSAYRWAYILAVLIDIFSPYASMLTVGECPSHQMLAGLCITLSDYDQTVLHKL